MLLKLEITYYSDTRETNDINFQHRAVRTGLDV